MQQVLKLCSVRTASQCTQFDWKDGIALWQNRNDFFGSDIVIIYFKLFKFNNYLPKMLKSVLIKSTHPVQFFPKQPTTLKPDSYRSPYFYYNTSICVTFVGPPQQICSNLNTVTSQTLCSEGFNKHWFNITHFPTLDFIYWLPVTLWLI